VAPEQERDSSPFISALIRRELAQHEAQFHPGEKVITITSDAAPRFCAGAVVRNSRVVRSAPIVGYMQGWTEDRVRSYAARRGWRIE
jgi:hypothetical protein